MSHGSYNTYIASRRLYRTPESCIAEGPQGSQGFQGRDGAAVIKEKLRGYTGFQGFTGFQGYTGAQGYTGFQGYTGYTGFQGFTGQQGYTGARGYTGFQGYTGYTGFQGFTGQQGFTGFQGYTGYTGFQGFTGFQGKKGEGTDIDKDTDISLNNLIVHGDLSANNAEFKDISVNNIFAANNNVSIGTAENPIKDMFVSANSLHIGNANGDATKISISSTGAIEFIKVREAGIDIPIAEQKQDPGIAQAAAATFDNTTDISVNKLSVFGDMSANKLTVNDNLSSKDIVATNSTSSEHIVFNNTFKNTNNSISIDSNGSIRGRNPSGGVQKPSITGFLDIVGENVISNESVVFGTSTTLTIKSHNPIQDSTGNEYYPDITPTTIRQYQRNNTTTPSSWDDNGIQNAIQFGRHIIPSENGKYDLGATGPSPRRWNQLFVNSIYMSGDTLEAGVVKAIKLDETGNVAMPPGSKIGGVNPGTIVIKGNLATIADLPKQADKEGDSYIVGSNLHVASNIENPTTWIDVGEIKGPRGAKGDPGLAGGAGLPGADGIPGQKGFTGFQGLVGAQGADGKFGGASFKYTLDTVVVANSVNFPGQGKLRFNNSTMNTSTKIFIDNSSNNIEISIDDIANTLDSVSSTIKGVVRISNSSVSSKYISFQITDLIRQSDWWELIVTHHESSEESPFSSSDILSVSFLTNGSKGDKGDRGDQGVPGQIGFTGFQGAIGIGLQGVRGYQGLQGDGANINENTDLTVKNLDMYGDLSANDASFNTIQFIGKLLKSDGTEFSGGVGRMANNSNQTFFDIMTQQPNKFKKNGTPSSTTATIDINWNYDDILANQTTNILAKLAFQSLEKNRSLPYIDTIKIDISGATTVNSNNTGKWINLNTFSISNSTDYNTAFYKTTRFNKTSTSQANNSDTKNILSKTDPFDARIYGINNAENYPDIETRALIFNNLQFDLAQPPNKPLYQSTKVNDNNMTVRYKVTEPEEGSTSSSATISEITVDYSQNETLSSSIHPIVTTTNSIERTSLNISANNDINTYIDGLRAGTKYNFKLKAKNNFRDKYSVFSDINESSFLNIPNSNDIGTTINLFSNMPYTRVTTPNSDANLSDSNVLYINSSETSLFTFSNTSNQYFEISDRNSSKSSTSGFGKYIESSGTGTELVEIKCFINNDLKQSLSYFGYNTSGTTTVQKEGIATRTNNTPNYFDVPSQEDIWSDSNKKGFRLKGKAALNNISNITTNIGPARTTKHTLKYTYENSSTNNTDVSSEMDIYMDTLTNNPSLSNTSSTTARVTSVVYTMGIPSVKTMAIDFIRKYENINSQFKYIRGDRKIASIGTISKTNKNSTKNITIGRSAINTTGIYEYNVSDFNSTTLNDYTNVYYLQNVGIGDENGTDLTISEKVYSLKTSSSGISVNQTLSVDHYFDYASCKNHQTNSLTSNLTLGSPVIYEINDITEINNKFNDLELDLYSTHENMVKDCTLLYLKGAFRTNASVLYPNINNYQWDIDIPNKYSAGTKSFTLTGTESSTNEGYKWIVFKFNGTSDITTVNTSNGNVSFFNVYQKLNSLGFSSTVLNKIVSSWDSNPTSSDMLSKDVLCLITQEDSNSNIRVGNLLYRFQTDSKWWTKDGGESLTYILSDTANIQYSSYGCLFKNSSDAWGAQVLNNSGNSIYLYLGLKNSVNLS
jgi:hypothetical protein